MVGQKDPANYLFEIHQKCKAGSGTKYSDVYLKQVSEITSSAPAGISVSLELLIAFDSWGEGVPEYFFAMGSCKV